MKLLLILLLITNTAVAKDHRDYYFRDDWDRQQFEVEREDKRNAQYRQMMGEEMREYRQHCHVEDFGYDDNHYDYDAMGDYE